MTRPKLRTSAAMVLCCAVTGLALVGCDDSETDTGSGGDAESSAPAEDTEADAGPFTGTQTISVGDKSITVSCSGAPVDGRPVVVLLHGGGHDLTTMADFQESLSAEGRVCSYDRLGAGASDLPDGLQDFEDIGETLTGVLDQIAPDSPVVLAGHSMGGLIAARYAPDHLDRVHGLVLLDATPPTQAGDFAARIPDTVTGETAEFRAVTLATFEGQNPEQLVFADAEVRPADDIPVRVIQHGHQYLAEMPEYGPGLEEDWAAGQEKWLALSTDSELSIAENSAHDIYLDEPEVALAAIENVIAGAAG
ncbi:alpha/beta fold hydrolase [Streptomyces profundus]|uniref:alpha/beta fold hydrolase n=1 Tax=Streptomyces profundus TaxID=2867410 RepID=UPI001D15F2C5|nr:alpha/beta hydrolase [Streptomyces sp. MA3_2.13]UED82772.1 alpha/beta hydrolase [Streptomyces sp. MA3_2.13]